MAISTAVAKQLCTKSELTLFMESSSKNVTAFNVKALRTRVARSRKLQDKYRQLASRQEREARGKQKPKGKRAAASSGATRKKEQAFAETRERFEKQLAKVEAAAKKDAATKKKAAKKPVKKTAKKIAKAKGVKKAAKKAPAKKMPVKKKRPQKSPPPAAKKKVAKKKSGVARKTKTKSATAKLTASGSVNRQKHRSADNKRRQARKDTRSSR